VKNINSESVQIKLDKDRREFIKTSTLIGVGVAASTVLPGAALANVAEEEKTANKQQGYQLTPHVIEYYKSAAS
jgi:hypothetical protein